MSNLIGVKRVLRSNYVVIDMDELKDEEDMVLMTQVSWSLISIMYHDNFLIILKFSLIMFMARQIRRVICTRTTLS